VHDTGLPPKVEIDANFIDGINGWGGHGRTQGHTIGNPLGHGHDVGGNAVLLATPHLAACASESGLDLVAYEQSAILAYDFNGGWQILFRWSDEPTDPLDRLSQ